MNIMNSAIVPEEQTPPPTPFVTFWNEVMAPKLIRFEHVLVNGLSHHSNAVFPKLPVKPGDTVLDVGCGFGDTSRMLAKMVAPDGSVQGVDCCEALVERARQDAAEQEVSNIAFATADAEISLLQEAFDFVFARFGTMFFANPVAGLRNMRKALKPGGCMTHIVWRRREDNPWLAAARDVLLEHLPQPDAGAPSCGPGPFSMADEDLVGRQMEAAGFNSISFERVDAKVLVGRTVGEAINFQLSLGPAGEIYRTAGVEAERKRAVITKDLTSVFEGADADEEGIWMDSSSWVISARN